MTLWFAYVYRYAHLGEKVKAHWELKRWAQQSCFPNPNTISTQKWRTGGSTVTPTLYVIGKVSPKCKDVM